MEQRCRCCLINSNTFFDIFEVHISGITYAEYISNLAEVQIKQNDGLTQQMCYSCSYEMRRVYQFCLRIRQADKKLRQELENKKNEIEDIIENVELLDNEYFSAVDDNTMQVCSMDEILEEKHGADNVLIVEEINDLEEINIVDEVLDTVKNQEGKSYTQKDNLLQSFAQIAASQENLNAIGNQGFNSNTDIDGPQDENDEEYLIEFDPNEVNNLKSQKWKCEECKEVLRSDVSYEGHMNIHRKFRLHKCGQCQMKYRCLTALNSHKKSIHSVSMQGNKSNNITILCMICHKRFYSENIFCLHEAIVHWKAEKCPFECVDLYDNNIKQHIKNIHCKNLIFDTERFYSNQSNKPTMYQCFICSEVFSILDLLQEHIKLCQTINEETFMDNNIINKNKNVIEIVKIQETDISVQCNFCEKKLLKINLKKHMELHKSKDENVKNDTSFYLCTLCPREFKSSKSLYQHKKVHHGESSDVVYVCADCERQYSSQYLLETHRKQAHKERDNICTICGNAFKLRNQLVNHMKLHLEKNIPCPHCDKKYARQFDLNVHLRSHTGEQPYACHLCEKRFAIKVRLTYHLQKHYGIKHYCKECGAEFNSKQKLKAHSFKHTGMPYRCQMCDDHGFATRNTFKRHLTRVHHTCISEEELNDMFQKNTGKNVNIKQIDEQNLVLTASEDDNQEEIEVLGK